MKRHFKTRRRSLTALLICLILTLNSSLPAAAEPPVVPQAPADGLLVYLPVVQSSAPPPTLDLSMRWIEVTQATQTSTLGVPLVEGRGTVARLYLQTNETAATSGVSVSLSAYRDGALLPGSPLALGPGSAHPTSLSLNQMRADLTKSLNVTLPVGWLSGQVTLQATLDPGNALAEFDEANNLTSLPLTFQVVPALDVRAVPIQYTHWTGTTYPPAPTDYIQAALLEVYPVSAVTFSVRAPIGFSGDLEQPSEWDRLLDKVTGIKKSDGAPASQVYYGVVPLLNSAGTSTWFAGGIAGLGIWNKRASIGLADADSLGINGKFIVQHEIGHNLGQEHAPCGVFDPDPDFPNPDGTTGEYGFKVAKFKLVLPAVFDVMGYCEPTWVSPYTYQSWLANQLANGDAASLLPQSSLHESLLLQESLLLRASLDPNGMPVLHPLYSFPASPDQEPLESEYAVELLDSAGAVAARHRLEVLHASAQEHSTRLISALLPLPGRPIASLRLLYRGQVVLEKSLDAGLAPLAAPTIEATEGGPFVLRWGAPLQAALVRVSADGGLTWQTLALDQRGGELLLDPGALPPGELLFEIRLSDHPGAVTTILWNG